MPPTRARKERRKLPFLKAFIQKGTITSAARVSRISRDAVYDWRHNDPSFERSFQNARRRHNQQPFEVLECAATFFKDVIHPIVPESLWPRITAELALAMTNLKRDLKEGSPRPTLARRAITSGQLAGVSLPPIRFEDMAIPIRGNGASARIL